MGAIKEKMKQQMEIRGLSECKHESYLRAAAQFVKVLWSRLSGIPQEPLAFKRSWREGGRCRFTIPLPNNAEGGLENRSDPF